MIKFFEKEPYSPVEYSYEAERILYKGKTKYQDIMVIENNTFGKILILDGIVQLTEKDEFFYHEMLTHIVMHSHHAPKRVAVIGGGDGGTVREVLKHQGVEKLYFVEIDEEVIKIAREFFPSLSSGLDDPRVQIKVMDGAEFIKRTDDLDIIIVDSTDIIGFARTLFTIDFFQSAKKSMNNRGMLVTHTESLHFHKEIVIEMQEMLKKVFPVVDLYTTPIATYPGNWWTFSIGGTDIDPRTINRHCEIKTRYYDSEIHLQSFLTKGFYRKLINRELDW